MNLRKFTKICFCIVTALVFVSAAAHAEISNLGVEGVKGVRSSGKSTDATFDITITSHFGDSATGNSLLDVLNPSQNSQALFSLSDFLDINAIIYPDSDDVGKTADIYIMAFVNNFLIFKNASGEWHAVNGPNDPLVPAMEPVVLSSSLPLEIISGLTEVQGHFNIYVGYSLTSSSDIVYSSYGLDFRTSDLFFTEVPVPETDQEKRSILASETVYVKGEAYSIGYHTILRSGDTVGGNTYGQLYDSEGNAIVEEDGSQRISNDNDFASLLPIGNKLFMVSHFESRPGAMYLTELSQDAVTGILTPVSTRNIDFSAVRGGWVHCAGSVTPWNTHLGSEEYEPDASMRDSEGHIDDYYDAMGAYYGGDLLELNPYDYGWTVEVAVLNEAGDTSVTKHYSMGRMAFELSYVMPDEKTAYLSDDGTNVGLYIYIADNKQDLTSGRIYAMKWHQTASYNGGAANLSWIDLGHATDSEIKAMLDAKLTFNDIFDRVDPNDDNTCPSGYSSVNTTWGHECLMVKTGMEKAASRLETRRYAAMLGATTELRKEEGVTYDPETNRLYVAISEIARGMEDFKKNGKDSSSYDKGGYNDIQLPYNLCGGVYALNLGTYTGIDSTYVGQNMYAIVTGRMVTYPDDSPYAGNTCDMNSLANPDNITYLPGFGTLIIGEDTGSGHQNDFIWSYDVAAGELTRIQTTPYGSETTSPYWYADINGFGYLMSVIQHPYGESDSDKLENPGESFAYTGYIGPFPSLKK